MLNPERFDHIRITDEPQISTYTATGGGGTGPRIKERSRNTHGSRIRDMLNNIKHISERLKEKPLPENITRDEGTYVEFFSHIGHDLIADSLHRTRSGIELLNAADITITDPETGEKKTITKAVVYIPDGKVDIFIRIVERYLTEEYRDTDKPKHKNFVESLEEIKIATLKSFWTDNLDFPDKQSDIWWEVWIRSHAEKEKYKVSPVETVIEQATNIGLDVSSEILEFPEHKVLLLKGTARQLSQSVLLLNNLAELRKAKARADFFTDFISGIEQEDWIDDLLERLEIRNENGPVICLLDSGVRNGHRLLDPIIPDDRLDAYKETWGTDDTALNGGHGTLMAGIALFGDLTNALASPNPIRIFHNIESVKIVEESDPNIPENYGAITEECVARSFIMDPDSYKIFCMAVTTEDFRDLGQPSSWSSAVDKIVFGDQEDDPPKLFFISGGNVYINNPEEYPDKNLTDQIHDPGQSWNALTIGTYTQKTDVNNHRYPSYYAVAQSGQMAPTNSTSFIWKNDWPYKPDVVFEGGNLAGNDDGGVVYDDALQVLSTSKNLQIRPLASFGATSSATASASKFAAEIIDKYPDYWPETIRGLIAHSSDWTETMRNQRDLSDFSKDEIENLSRQVGYGVPNVNRALNSASNSLTLIAQNEFKPFRLVGNRVKTDHIHLYDLPWPREQLLQLSETDVRLKITLSYFVEPNPGRRYYSSKFYYQSHGLRFDVIRVNETIMEFRQRKNREARDEDYDGTDTDPEHWLYGARKRTRGSLHKDIWFGNAADLATKNQIIIFPVTGWWRTRKNLEKYVDTVRYSLIASIETPPTEIDIYTPVFEQIMVEVSKN
jgi:hypothetical protein